MYGSAYKWKESCPVYRHHLCGISPEIATAEQRHCEPEEMVLVVAAPLRRENIIVGTVIHSLLSLIDAYRCRCIRRGVPLCVKDGREEGGCEENQRRGIETKSLHYVPV